MSIKEQMRADEEKHHLMMIDKYGTLAYSACFATVAVVLAIFSKG